MKLKHNLFIIILLISSSLLKIEAFAAETVFSVWGKQTPNMEIPPGWQHIDYPQPKNEGYATETVISPLSYLHIISENYIPQKQQLLKKICISSTSGEYEPASFALRSKHALFPVEVTVAELRNKNSVIE